MKQILYSIMMCCLMVTFLTACSQENDPFPQGEGTKGNSITLKLSTGIQFQTRAEAAGAEVAVSHLDVFIFGANENMQHYERVSNCTDQQGTVTLAASKDDFDENTGYYVYLLANSTHTEDDFKNLANLSALKAMTQEDERIHITGLSNIAVAPKTFLMDGIAYSGEQEPQAATTVVLNDGNPSTDTELKVMLRRAAAKIIIHVNNKGDAVTFDKEQEGATPDYYLRNMPYSTSLLAGVEGEAKLRTSMKSNTSYYEWNGDGTITLTAYTYAHKWADASAFENEVRLVVNIPLKYTKDGQETAYPASYYQIPVCKDKVLERNTCYEVTVTVSAPGGTDPSAPVELSGIEYTVTDWTEKVVGIGGDDEHPIYLYVNEEEMEMHNITDDNTTLEFASSSAVSATVTRVYYIDKFGQEQVLEKISGTDNEYGIKTGNYWNPTWTNRCTIKITPDEGINGKLDVYSTLPENNTIRYIDFEVTNADKITRKVTVTQYPLEYITNIQSKYSYRDDFKINDSQPTTYNYMGDRVYGISLATRNITNWNGQYTYEISTNDWWGETNTSSGFFRSKYVSKVNEGKSTILHYYWNSRNQLKTSSSGEYNGRLYHIRLTATSDTYTVGVPRLIEDEDNPGLMVTDPGKDNEMLVSPSFMIASSLGGFMLGSGNLTLDDSQNSLRVAREHCANYVEVAWDGTVYDDWRLPTRAELNIIMNFQGSENEDADAIDYLLNAQYYYSANGRVENSKKNMNGTGVRCVRDAYETE